MTRWVLVALLIAMSASCAPPRQTVAETETEEQVLRELRQLQITILAGVQRKDMAALERIWSKEYLATSPDGMLVTRSDLLGAVSNGVIKLESLDISDLKARLFGDVALLTGHADVKATVNGEDYSGAYRGTGIYVKREGRWQPVGLHVSPIRK